MTGRKSLSTDKKWNIRAITPLPGVKAGESVPEKAPSYKVEEPSSTEMREQPSQEKVHADLDTKAKEAAERYAQLLRLGAEFENYKKRVQKENPT